MKDTLPKQMTAVNVLNPGKQSELSWQTVATPQPEPGQLLIKVAAAGINRADLMQRQGFYPAPAGDSPILGLEAAGTVVAVGDDSLANWLGKAVFGLVNGGGYAEYVLLPVKQAMLVPQGWSMTDAAATAETFLTAYQLLFTEGQLQSGQRVLLHAGASGVGTSALQLAKAKSIETAVTVSTLQKATACERFGASLAINYQTTDYVAVLKQAWPNGVDLILDPVAGSYIPRNIEVLAQDGKIIVYALMGGRKVADFELAKLFAKRGQIQCSTLRNRSAAYKAQLTAAFQQDFAAHLDSANIKPVIQQIFAACDVASAHQLLSSNQTIGKLVLAF